MCGWCVLHRRTIVPHMSPRALRAYPPARSPGRCPSSTGRVSLLFSCGAVVVIPVGFPPRPAARRRGWRRRRGGKRWLARIFRVRGGSRVSGKWRHCATSGWKGRGAGGERYALATFLSRRTAPSPARPNPRRDGRGERGGCDDDLACSVVHGCARVRVGEVPREPQPHRGRILLAAPAGRRGTPLFAETCTSHSKVQFQEGYSGVVLKAWSVKVVVMVCSGGSGAPSPLRLDSASRMVGRRLVCRDAAGSRDRHLTREHVT